ncbi:MAG: hypothetical protein KTR16_06990 [Acidiferrobacterales bacterium]|nr:hypothetical protein [Acidiferrobacterales bacterium]
MQVQMTISPKPISKALATFGLISAGLLMGGNAQAGAWVAEKGKSYSKLGVSDYSATDFFGDQPDLGEFEGQNISYYGEFGLGNNWGLFTSVLYQDISQTNAAGEVISNSGLSDLDIGLKYQIQAEPFVLSAQLLAKLPYLYDEDDTLPLGNGQEDLEAKVLIGKSLNRWGYFGLEFGYRYRTDAPSDEYRYLIEYGVSLTENLYFRTKLDGIESVGNADSVIDSTGVNLSRTPEFDVGKLEITAGWNFGEANQDGGRWGAEFTYTQDLYGEQTLEGDGFQLAVTRAF